MRDYLVFVRAGINSLHPSMLAQDPQRNWDCCVNAWDDPGEGDADKYGVEYCCTGGTINKFEAFTEMLRSTEALRRYRYIMLIDDDLQFAPGDVSRFFDRCSQMDLFVSQPAIAWGSNANHLINIRNPMCIVRRVNFVEVMAPCFSSAAIEELLPTFLLTKCTWGIDDAWSSLLNGRGGLSVVDDVPMHHTKPMDRVNGPFYRKLRSMGIEPDEELATVHRNFPEWGPMRSLPDGHAYRFPLPRSVNSALVAAMEARKIGFHLRRGGTIVNYKPVEAAANLVRAPA